MSERVILEAVVGSTLHGVSVNDGLEDLDLMGVCVETMDQLAGFSPRDTWVSRTKPDGVRSEAGDVDRVVYGLRKYLSLALKGNPSILLPLFAPADSIVSCDSFGHELRGLAGAIVSKRCFGPFRGYMKQQRERLCGARGQRRVTRPELVAAHGFDTKYAAHIVRLGYQGIELLDTGRISLPMVTAQRWDVLETRKGHYSLAELLLLFDVLERNLERAHDGSPLPDAPDRKRVEAWMLSTYKAFWT